MFDNKTLATFYRLFRGNPSFFVKHQAPFEEKEGKLKASWCGFSVYNKRNPPPEGSEYGDFIPVTKERYREHLNGGDGLAIAPLTNTEDQSNVCFYAVIDIDVYGHDFTWLVNRLYHAGFKFAAFLSKSGGLHIYFFFAKAEPGKQVIAALKKIVEVFGLDRLFVNVKTKSKVEIFPKQDAFVPGDTNVNCLMLPFYNAANKSKQNMLTAEGKLVGIVKALPIIASMLTSVKDINATLDALPYSDAPFCMQMILLTGALAERDGRNVFLFAVALYLKIKSVEEVEDALLEANSCLEVPLEEREVHSIYTSAMSKDWPLPAWCEKEPLCSYCDKALCKKRTFGVGRERNNYVSDVEFGKIICVKTEKPYYLWEMRRIGSDDYVQVRLDSEDDLTSQKAVQNACIRHLRKMPVTIKQSAWEKKIAPYIEQIEDREVPRSADTSEPALLRNLFLRYLLRSRLRNNNPALVQAGQAYYTEGKYYFTTPGIAHFLHLERFRLGNLNLHASLIDYGCKPDVLPYKTVRGETKAVDCLSKEEDAEIVKMAAVYKDMYESDEEVMKKNEPDKENEEKESDEEDTKF